MSGRAFRGKIPVDAVEFLRRRLGGSAAAELAESDPASSWPCHDAVTEDRLLRALEVQGASGLLYQCLRDDPVVPERIRRSLAASAMGIAARNAVLLTAFEEVLESLAAAGVPVVTLKGVALVATVYENPGLRPMADLDLLCADEHLDSAAAVLDSLGYEQAPSDAPGQVHHWAFVRRGDADLGLLVEVHRHLFAMEPFRRALPTEAVMGRARPAELARTRPVNLSRTRSAELAGTRLMIPDPADLLLHVAGHLTLQHPGNERLIWVADVDRCVRRWSGEGGFWAVLWRRAEAAQLDAALEDALGLAHFWFGTPVEMRPESLHEVGDIDHHQPSADAYRHARARPPIGQEGARIWRDLVAAPDLTARIRMVMAYAFPSPSYMRRWYAASSNWQLPYLYVRRLVRGVSEAVRGRPATGHDAPPADWLIEERQMEADAGDDGTNEGESHP